MLTEERRRHWQAYVDELLLLMELRDWRVEVRPDPPEDEETAAHITVVYGRKAAMIQLGTVHEEYTAEEQRHSLVHELIHCHLEPAVAMIMDGALISTMGMAAYRVLADTFRRQYEYGVDAIAVGWADALPLPPGDRAMDEAEVEELFDLEPGDVQAADPLDELRPLTNDPRSLLPLPPDAAGRCKHCHSAVIIGTKHRPVEGEPGTCVVEAVTLASLAEEHTKEVEDGSGLGYTVPLSPDDLTMEGMRRASTRGLEITDLAVPLLPGDGPRTCSGCGNQLPDELPCHFTSTCPGGRALGKLQEEYGPRWPRA